VEDERKAEREQTDESLRSERERADQLGDVLREIDETADAVISKARARADAVLAAARAKSDRTPSLRAQSGPRADVVQRREREDEILEVERARADETLREERAEHVALLSVERAETDKDLSSERVRADEALSTRDEFLAVVSHDLRNMLGAVVGFAGLIVQEASHGGHAAPILSHARRIERSAARMNRLIGDLIDVASIEAGTLAVTRELEDPKLVVAEAVDTFHAQAAAKQVSLVAETEPSSSPASFDAARILQVLINLLSNAIKFTAAHGRVVVRARRVDDEMQFSVSDTGSGIPSDKLGVIFDRFIQVKKDDARGMGLGLYISKCIVQGHGGRIWAESTLGEGSTVYFTLPLQPPARP
jgi:signal transduction histidine kinase